TIPPPTTTRSAATTPRSYGAVRECRPDPRAGARHERIGVDVETDGVAAVGQELAVEQQHGSRPRPRGRRVSTPDHRVLERRADRARARVPRGERRWAVPGTHPAPGDGRPASRRPATTSRPRSEP